MINYNDCKDTSDILFLSVLSTYTCTVRCIKYNTLAMVSVSDAINRLCVDLKAIEYEIFGEGSHILTNQKREKGAFSLLIG